MSTCREWLLVQVAEQTSTPEQSVERTPVACPFDAAVDAQAAGWRETRG